MTIRSLIRAAAAVAVLLLVGGLARADATKADAESAIAAAEAARAAAAELKYEWNTTAPLIDEAKAATAAGDYAKAVALADKAKAQGDEAVAQAKREHEAWKGAVVR